MLVKISIKRHSNSFRVGFLIFLILNFLPFAGNSQNFKSIENKNLTLNKTDYTLKEIFSELEKNKNIFLSFNENELDLNQKVKLSGKNLTVKQILSEVEEQTDIDYKFASKQIIIRKKQIPKKIKSTFSLSGYVKDNENGESLIGVNVYLQGSYQGSTTNVYGFYSLTLPGGKHKIVYSYLGFEEQIVEVDLTKNTTLSIELKTATTKLEEVVIKGEKKNENIVSHKMGYEKLQPNIIKRMPVLLGESDVIKTLKFLPGVQSTGETSSGLSVRGGNYDQNLIILDEATVYNASHFLGFFSVFNTDAINNVEFYKGNIPAEYSGRLSSVIDIRMKEGDMKKLSIDGGIGLIASKLTISAPIVKDKGSFLISGRRTYVDLFTAFSKNEDTQNTKVFFYDLNLKANYKINNNNRIYLSGYFGKDHFGVKDQEPSYSLRWGNYTGTLRWNHLYGSKLFSNVSFIVSNYNFSNEMKYKEDGFKWDAQLEDYTTKIDFSYFPNPKNTIKFGVHSTFHYFSPGKVESKFDTLSGNFKLPRIRSLESGIYLGNNQKITPKFSIQYGLHYSLFQNVGKNTIYTYNDQYEHTDTTVYDMGEIFNTQGGFEPRVSMNYVFNDYNSVKASYSRTRQYIQRVSNTSSGTPLDIWIPSNPNVKPQIGDLYSVGYFRNLKFKDIKTSIEFYYSDMQNQIDFKDHAEVYLTEEIEKEMRFGKARAYGMEVSIKKETGKFNGWISYTLSRAERKIESLNNDEWYLSPYDRTHNLSIVMNYEVTKRISLSANWVYTSGQAFTSPTGKYRFGNKQLLLYSGKNEDRLPAYHRLDLGVQIKSKPNPERKFNSTVNLSVYNAYSAKNPMMSIVFVEDEDDPTRMLAKKYYLPIIPTISYNFNF